MENKMILRIQQTENPDNGRLVYEWYFENEGEVIAAGYASTYSAAKKDAQVWQDEQA